MDSRVAVYAPFRPDLLNEACLDTRFAREVVSKPRGRNLYAGLDVVTVIHARGCPICASTCGTSRAGPASIAATPVALVANEGLVAPFELFLVRPPDFN